MKKQIKLLNKIVKILKNNNIEYFLNYGTLLGAIREGSFLDHDRNDIDIGVKYEDYWKVKKLLDKNEDLKYKGIWRTEIAVYLEEGCHLDIFFYYEENNYLKTCAYIKNNMHGGVNVESAMLYKKENIFPTKTIKFCNKNFSIPNNPEAYLAEQYGEDWKTPVTKWFHSKVQCFDNNHRTIGILIPTFLRDKRMMESIESILQMCSKEHSTKKLIRIYVGDQGYNNWSDEKIEFYNKLEKLGHKIYKLPFNCGLSYARNYLVEQSTEKYLMIVDDDFKFNNNTNLSIFLDILNHREENGIVGGDISNRSTYHADLVFEQRDKDLHLYRIKRTNEQQSVNRYNVTYNPEDYNTFNYYYTDIVLNFFLAKREVLEQVPLDNNLKVVEHSDHFLRIKKHNKWKVCYCPTVTCEHLEGKSSDEYINFRQNINYVKMFFNKWGIKDERHFHKIEEKPISQIDIKEEIIKDETNSTKKIKVVQIARIPCANSGYELSQLLNKYSSKYESKYILGHEYGKRNNNIPYRQFPYELFWEENQQACIDAIKEADIVHVHHDTWDEILPYLKGKKVVSTLYNLTNSLQYDDSVFNRKYISNLKKIGAITIADQPLQKKMFSEISNIYVPLIKMLFDYKINKDNKIKVGFSPTNRMNDGIGSKRFDDVINIIKELQKEYIFNFDLIEGVPYEENILRKSKCHILIDDVDDKFEKAHNTTLEASLLDAVALTNYSGDWYPAIKTNINNLKITLEALLKYPSKIEEHKRKLDIWKSEVYTPNKLVDIYENVYNQLNTKEILIQCDKNSIKEDFELIYNLFINNDVMYCITNKTCLETVLYGKLTIEKSNLYFGVDNIEKAQELLKTIKINANVYLEKYNGKTKLLNCFGNLTNVPFPVINYLNNKFGRNWRNL